MTDVKERRTITEKQPPTHEEMKLDIWFSGHGLQQSDCLAAYMCDLVLPQRCCLAPA